MEIQELLDLLGGGISDLLGPDSAEAAGISPQEYDRRQALKQQEAQRIAEQKQQIIRAAQEANAPTKQLQNTLLQQRVAKGEAAAQTPRTLAEILGNQQAQPGQENQAEFPITFGQDPKSGTWAFNNRGWVGLPEEGSLWRDKAYGGFGPSSPIDAKVFSVARNYATPELQQQVAAIKEMLNPTEGLGLTEEEHRAAIQGYTSRGEPVPEILNRKPPPSAAATPTSALDPFQMTPQEQQQLADYSSLLEHQKVPADVRTSMIEKQFPKIKAQREAEKRALHRDNLQAQRELSPAKPGIYLDAKGSPINTPLLHGDIVPGTSFYQQGSPQAKVYGATGQVNSHVDRTLEHLQAISKIDSNRFQRYLTTQLKYFRNDEDIVALKDFLSPASAGAVANSYSATSVGMRGGATLIEIYRKAVYAEGDDLKSVLTKLRDLELVNKAGVEHTGLHPAVAQAAQDRIDVIDKLLGEAHKVNKTKPRAAQAPASQPTPMNIPPGQAPVINPQGKLVTIPIGDLQEALKPENGYKPYQP